MSATTLRRRAPGPRERIYRHNFLCFTLDGTLFMVAIGIIGATTVLPDFVRRLTDSEILIGLTGSLFTLGFTLPQLFIARLIMRHARKKRWFVLPNIPVRMVILLFALLIPLIGAERPQLLLLAFFLCYSGAALGDGLVGVPWADLVGSSLDARWRARMLGSMSGLTGLIMLAAVPLVALVLGDSGPGFPHNYALLFGVAGALFALSILPVFFVAEIPASDVAERTPALGEYLPWLGKLLRADPQFRAFLLAKSLAILSLMAAPFYIGYATGTLGLSSEVAVPTLLAMQTLGAVGGALLYTWLGARDNALYIHLALAGAATLPLCALLAKSAGMVMLAFGFLVSGIATANLFFAFQNWVLSHALPSRRPASVGISSLLTAIFSLLAPLVGGSIAQHAGYEPLFIVSLLLTLAALAVMLRHVRAPAR